MKQARKTKVRSKTNMAGAILPPASAAPEFRAGGIRYGIDTCDPQIRAMAAGKIRLHALTHGHYPGTPMPPQVLPGINSLGFWDVRGPQDWSLDPHRNEGIEIVFLETGRMAFTVDGRPFPMAPGSVSITRPWQLHSLGNPCIGASRLHWLLIDVGVRRPSQPWQWPSWVVLVPEDLAELTRKLRHNEHPVWQSTPEIAQAFQELAAGIQQAEQAVSGPPSSIPASRLLIQINRLLLGLLEMLRRQCQEENPELVTRHRTVELFLADLERHPEQLMPPWTLRSMARHCGMGSTSFTQLCRRISNQSPMDYLNRCRFNQAARRLRAEPGTQIATIAAECGFSSSQYFATRFRRHFGCTPRECRTEARH
jgi:AraC family L-rhamnose operon regulatory protein RhaS